MIRFPLEEILENQYFEDDVEFVRYESYRELEQELQKTRDEINSLKSSYKKNIEALNSGLDDDLLKTLRTYPTALPYICELKQELQKTREQLNEAEKVIEIYSNPESDEWISHRKELHGVKVGVYKDVYSLSSFAKQYFQDKDKQGEG